MTRNATINFTKWLLVTFYLVVSLSFVRSANRRVVCNQIDVIIDDSLNNAFITKRDIMKVLEQGKTQLKGKPLHEINTLELEDNIAQFGTVKRVEAYKTINGRLAIRVNQRKPLARIINRGQESYYLDEEGKVFPWSNRYTSHVLIINGNIVEPFQITSNLDLKKWRHNNPSDTAHFIFKLFEFAQYIANNPFWNSQIVQVYVESPKSIELIPRVGGHSIHLGSLDFYEDKMAKLRVFYEDALPYEGWNKYKKISLKYRNQIVCTKR